MADIHFLDRDASDIYNEIIQMLETSVMEPLFPGDERRIFGEALTAVLVSAYAKMDDAARQKMLRYARGEVLDALGERTGTARLPSAKAYTILLFELAAPSAANIIIPSGTKVMADGSAFFATDLSAVIPAGSLSVSIPARSTEGGSAYNRFLPGTVTTLVDLIPMISGVTNTIESYGGDDGEPYTEAGDNRYRERIRISSARFSTAGAQEAYEFFAMSADPDIASVGVTSPEPGHILLTPIMTGGVLPTQDVLDKVIAVCSADDVRPLTDYVIAAAPETHPFDIDFKYYISAADETAAVQTIEKDGSIQKYIEWQTGALGRDINPDQLRRFVLAPDWADGLTGALRLDIINPVFTALDDMTVARFSGNLTVSHEVVWP